MSDINERAYSFARRRRAGGEKRKAALGAAVRVLSERGYERTRFSDVADEQGVAVSTLQHYFGSREDMLIEALREATEREVLRLEEAVSGGGDAWGRLVILFERGLATDVDVWRMLLEFLHAASHDEELRIHSEWLYGRYRQPFLDAIREGVERGEFDPRQNPEDVVSALIAQLDGLAFPQVLRHPYFDSSGVRGVALRSLEAIVGRQRGSP